MKRLRLVLAVLLLSVPATAHAALIGLVGGDFDPPPITDPSTRGFVNCNEALPGHEDERLEGFFCIFYNAFDPGDLSDGSFFAGLDSIFSLDFILTYLGIPVTTGLSVPEFSDLPILSASEFSDDGLRLSGGTIVPNSCPPGTEFCRVVNAVALFIGPDRPGDPFDFENFQSRNLAVNNVATVPEPASLLLIGPAALAMLTRRRARRERR